MSEANEYQCDRCGSPMNRHRYEIGYTTCMKCGEEAARQHKHTIVPMHKSNYIVVTNREDLKGINNKGGFYR
jgi:ribosomal protein L37AE/L43A